jgi:hypothetical protein
MRSGSVGRTWRMAMSASRRRRSLIVLDTTTATVMRGASLRMRATMSGRMCTATASEAEMATRPTTSCAVPAAASAMASAAAAIACACSSNPSPASVSTSDLPTRSNSVTPSAASSAATCRDNVGCVSPSPRAAADNEPASVVAQNARARFQSSGSIRKRICGLAELVGEGPVGVVDAGLDPNLQNLLARHPAEGVGKLP